MSLMDSIIILIIFIVCSSCSVRETERARHGVCTLYGMCVCVHCAKIGNAANGMNAQQTNRMNEQKI